MSLVDREIKKLDRPGREKFKRMCLELGFEYGEPKRKDLMYDCHFTYKGKKYIVEIKDRSAKVEDYDTFFIEKEQYDAIMAWKEKLDCDGCYFVNFFGDTAYAFDLCRPEITSSLEEIWMSWVTAIDPKKKRKKAVYKIPKKIGAKYKLGTKKPKTIENGD